MKNNLKIMLMAYLFAIWGFLVHIPPKKECQYDLIYHEGVISGIKIAGEIYVDGDDVSEAMERHWHPEKYF